MRTFNLPDLGEGLQEAEIVNWHVQIGDVVKVDQPLISVETAKAVVDVPSPWAGKIVRLHGKAGDIVPTHAALVEFDIDGGDEPVGSGTTGTIETPQAGGPNTPSRGTEAGDTRPAVSPDTARHAIAEDSGTVVGNIPTGNDLVAETAIIRRKRGPTPVHIKALPSVRILAKQLGVELADCAVTGKNETVSADDVRRQSNEPMPATSQAPATVTGSGAPMPRADVKYGVPSPLRGPRRAMHTAMTRARNEVVACTLFDDADIHNWAPGQDITVRIIRAIVSGCRGEPELNAWYDGEKLERTLHERVDLAIAVDTLDGLIVPVLREVGRKTAQQLRADLDHIKESTRQRTVAPADMKDATFTLSNFGMMAGRYATPVVVPPQVAILGTGGLRYDVVPVMGGIEVHQRIPLSITFDHRCITGGTACRWLAVVIADLQKAQ